MSIFKVNATDFQSITVTTNPSKYYSSSSSGITGSLRIFARKSFVEKDIEKEDDPNTPYNESGLFTYFQSLINGSKDNNNGELAPSIIDKFVGDINVPEGGFLDEINKTSLSLKKKKELYINRFTPTTDFLVPPTKENNKTIFDPRTFYSLSKLAIKNNLSHHYRATYPSSHWGYSNYHCLNFFSSSTVPTSSVLLYPNHDGSRYTLSGAFSLDFHINPRYKTLDADGHFKAGTIFHVSSSYALSLITGSLKDVNGLPDGFRLQLQLGRSTGFSPSSAVGGPSPKDLIFLSDDNSLKWNHWHHVVVRWGTNSINHGTGSFVVDGIERGTFDLPYDSFTVQLNRPLCIGNYYEGNDVGTNSTHYFFNLNAAANEGVYSKTTNTIDPINFLFAHPLQAEVHNLSIKKFYMSDDDIAASGSTGISNFKDVAFYLPPFFSFDSPRRGIRNGDTSRKRGVLLSPAEAVRGITTTPFNVHMAFGVNGHYINTENFLKDFVSGSIPRQLFLTASLVEINSNNGKSANEILYEQPAVRKRNLTILPCDDGTFYPDYTVLQSNIKKDSEETYVEVLDVSRAASVGIYYDKLYQDPNMTSYIDDLGNKLEGFITLNSMIVERHWEESSENVIVDGLGPTVDNPTAELPNSLGNKIDDKKTLLNPFVGVADLNHLYVVEREKNQEISYRMQDGSSNQVTFFDISNLFYGNRILPGSFTITDSNLSGSGGAVSITIKDNGQGTLYRADSLTPHCTWNSVGTIFYDEGIIAIKSPHLYFFGEKQYEMSFKGEQNLHVLRLETLAPTNHLNSSSNPSYVQVPSTNRPNEPDSDFVYITGINFHDDNLNVVMKTQLAQPIMKRHSEKIMFKVKYDF